MAVFEGVRDVLTAWNRERAVTLACFASFRFWSLDESFWFNEDRVVTVRGGM